MHTLPPQPRRAAPVRSPFRKPATVAKWRPAYRAGLICSTIPVAVIALHWCFTQYRLAHPDMISKPALALMNGELSAFIRIFPLLQWIDFAGFVLGIIVLAHGQVARGLAVIGIGIFSVWLCSGMW